MLILSLAITPLRLLSPRLTWLIKFRRLLGLFAFFYASLHLATYVALYMNFDLSVFKTDITKRRFIIAGFPRIRLLVPLAATSTTGPFANSAASAGTACTSWSISRRSAESFTTGGRSNPAS